MRNIEEPKKGKQSSSMYDFQNIHTGPNSTHPGVLKAQEDKKKADANLAAYKKKVEDQKKQAYLKAKKHVADVRQERERIDIAKASELEVMQESMPMSNKTIEYYHKRYQ